MRSAVPIRLGMTLVALFPMFLAAVPSAAQDFDGFRIPEHRLLSWNGDVRGSAQRSRLGEAGASSESRSISGTLGSRFDGLIDSDPVRSRLEAFVTAFGDRSRLENEQTYPGTMVSSLERGPSTAEFVRIGAEQRRYVWDAPVGVIVEGSGFAVFSQRWHHAENTMTDDGGGYRSQHWDDLTFHATRRGAEGSVSVGVGRVRDASDVFDAWILERRLAETGAILGPLSRRTRERLSELLALRNGWSSVMERPERTIWREVEELLKSDGALSERGLDAYSVLRAGESVLGSGSELALPRSPIARTVGSFVGPVISVRHEDSRFHDRRHSLTESTWNDTVTFLDDQQSSGKGHFSRTELLGGARGEIHRPLGERWQLDAEARALVPIRAEEHGWEIESQIGFGWIVVERWLVTGYVKQSRWIRQGEPQFQVPSSGWIVGYGGSVLYFLEDHLALALTAQETQQFSSATTGTFGYSYSLDSSGRNAQVTLGVSYTFTGRLTAPGLTAPIRTPVPIGS